jgi:hypothetical protein
MRARLIVIVSLFIASTVYAQAITGTLRGTVTSADDGTPMAEAEVTIVHEPTGTEKSTTTNADGAFAFTGLRVGGPYHVIANFTGFKTAEEKGLVLTADKTVEVTLALSLQAEVIEVKGTAVPRATSGRQVITSEEIQQLPSIDRDPRDMVRRTPEVTVEGSSHVMSVGGMNPRFNSITIDGLRMDDDFGLNSSGYPTRRSPIPLSAIEQMIVEQAPFDVRYDKFLGGTVNIITKSGTNDLHGELLGTYSSDSLIGHHTGNNTLTGTQFHEYRYGTEISGPLIKDRLHFVFAADGLRASVPTSVGPEGSGAANITSKVTQDELAMAEAISKSVYGFDPGVASTNLNESNYNLFTKLDYTADEYNRITATYLHNGGDQIQEAFANSTILPLTSQWYDAVDTLDSGSVRWFSDLSDRLSTELSVSGKAVSSRVPPLQGNGFMAATIFTPEGGQIKLGPDDFRHTNVLDTDLLQGRGVANYLAGNHLVTGGVEYELLHVHNLFIPDTNGAAQYASLADFMNKKPSQILVEAATTPSLEGAAANYNTTTIAPFLQDQLKLTSQLTVTGGVRFELYKADQNIVNNPTFATRYSDLGLKNTDTLDGKTLLMPRLGVSYLALPTLNLRAGGGLYSGGTPTVWMSNNYTNDGMRITQAFDNNLFDVQGFDGRHIPAPIESMLMRGQGNVDALDPKFKLPSAWKVGTGADWELPASAMLKLNYVYTRVQNGVFWVDLRRCNSVTSTQGVCQSIADSAPLGTLPDGRQYYDQANFPNRLGYDMMLSNNDGYGRHVGGSGHTASAMLSKQFPFGLYVSGSYAYQHVLDATPANSSRSVSNYANVAVYDPNAADVARSDYETTHRFTLALEYSHPLFGDVSGAPAWKNMNTSFGLFAETRSGQPYSWVFGDSNAGAGLSSLFGEDQSIAKADRMLFYVPKGDGSDVILNGIDPAQFNAFLKQTGLDKYRGHVAPRNAFTGNWLSRVDVRFAQDIPNPLTRTHRAKFFVDIQNVGNMIDKNWGRVTMVGFPYAAIAVDVNRDPMTGKYVYSNLRPVNQNRVDLLASVWKMALGLSYDF